MSVGGVGKVEKERKQKPIGGSTSAARTDASYCLPSTSHVHLPDSTAFHCRLPHIDVGHDAVGSAARRLSAPLPRGGCMRGDASSSRRFRGGT